MSWKRVITTFTIDAVKRRSDFDMLKNDPALLAKEVDQAFTDQCQKVREAGRRTEVFGKKEAIEAKKAIVFFLKEYDGELEMMRKHENERVVKKRNGKSKNMKSVC